MTSLFDGPESDVLTKLTGFLETLTRHSEALCIAAPDVAEAARLVEAWKSAADVCNNPYTATRAS